jgi:ribosomal protein L37AE/L43A
MDNLCDGSRMPVRGKRHKLQVSATGHMKATCPACKRRLTVRSVMGVVEFPRHQPKEERSS